MHHPLPFQGRVREGKGLKILVRAPNWVGDGVMATPALAALRSCFAQAQITLLAKPAVSSLLLHHPDIDRILLYEDPGKHAGPIGFLKLAATLRRERFDLAFLLQNAFEAAALAAFAGIPKRIGYDTDGRRLLLTGRLPRKDAPQHQREAFSALGSLIGATVKNRPHLWVQNEEVSAIRMRLESFGISKADRRIGICPGSATGPAKQWIPERFAEVADQLAERFQANILLLGGPNDRPVSEIILRKMKTKAVLLAGRISLREMMAVISLCDLCITNDSGSMHIASALDIPYVTLFGSTSPDASFPGGERGRKIYHPVNCSPCWLRVCPVEHHCMTAIAVQEVFMAAEEVMPLANKGRGFPPLKMGDEGGFKNLFLKTQKYNDH